MGYTPLSTLVCYHPVCPRWAWKTSHDIFHHNDMSLSCSICLSMLSICERVVNEGKLAFAKLLIRQLQNLWLNETTDAFICNFDKTGRKIEQKVERGRERERLADMDVHTSAWWKRSSVVFSNPSPLGNQYWEMRKGDMNGKDGSGQNTSRAINKNCNSPILLSEWVIVASTLSMPHNLNYSRDTVYW